MDDKQAPAEPKLRAKRLLVFGYLATVFLLTSWWAFVSIEAAHAYKLGDWLINYSAGFVRRGFMGSFVFWLESVTAIRPSVTVFMVQVGCYLSYFGFAGSLLLRQKSLAPYLLLLFSPYLFTFQLSDVGGGYRKEVLFLAVMAMAAWASVCLSVRSFRLVMFGIFLTYPLLILSHEMLAAFLPYLVAIYAIRIKIGARELGILSLMLVPSILAFVFAVGYPATPELVNAMCQNLTSRYPDICRFNSAIDWLDKSPRYANEMLQERLRSARFLETYSLAIGLGCIAFIPIHRRFMSLTKYPLSAALIGISLLGTLVMFFGVLDWGRLIYVNFAALFLMSLVLPLKPMTQSHVRNRSKWSSLLAGSWPSSRLGAAALISLIVCYSFFWWIPHITNGQKSVLQVDRPIWMARSLWWSIDRHLSGLPPKAE